MKELITLARESPSTFWLLVFFLVASGSGGGYISKALGQDDVKKQMREYTDSQVDGVRKDMNNGFDSVNCTLVQMQKESAQSELYGLEERETSDPNADRRRRIKQLDDKVKTLSSKLEGCK